MKFKLVEQAKENWLGLKEQQKAYVFQAVWFGKLVPGMPRKEELKAKGIINDIKKRVGKFPGLMYASAYNLIEEYEKGKVSEKELVDFLKTFYPVQARFGLKVSEKEIEFNKDVQNKLLNLNPSNLKYVLDDLKQSELRDKLRVLKTI